MRTTGTEQEGLEKKNCGKKTEEDDTVRNKGLELLQSCKGRVVTKRKIKATVTDQKSLKKRDRGKKIEKTERDKGLEL